MGNGKGQLTNPCSEIVLDPNAGVLTEDMLHETITKAVASFGTANHIFLNPQMVSGVGFMWHINPEFEGLPWASKTRLTKRERKVAHLHMFLFKVGALKNMREQEHEEFVSGAIRRIKRASWAKYSTLAKQANSK